MIRVIRNNRIFNIFCETQHWRYFSSIPEPIDPEKPKAEGYTDSPFVDFACVHCKGGDGGDGIVSFLRRYRRPYCGPDGGDGGNGGHIIFEADYNVRSLEALKRRYRGKKAPDGKMKSCHGANANHTIIKVPIGTEFCKNDTGEIVSNLNNEGDLFLAARGGAGGHGNRYYMNSRDTIPLHAEKGGLGEENEYAVELRVMAHAGLVGFPNVGKSTFLRAISRARPKVASYPFTTLRPHVGMVLYDDFEQLAVADIPGLISGAHLNEGLGFSFLRHVERCLCLFYVLDMSLASGWLQLKQLQNELELYRNGLSSRPHAILANKMDVPGCEQNLKELKEKVDLPVFPVSAKTREGLRPLLIHFREIYEKHKVQWHGQRGTNQNIDEKIGKNININL